MVSLTGVRVQDLQPESGPAQFRTLFMMFTGPSDDNQEAWRRSPSSEWSRSLLGWRPDRQQVDRERPDVKFKDRKQVRSSRRRRGDAVRARRQVRYQEIRPERERESDSKVIWQGERVSRSWSRGREEQVSLMILIRRGRQVD